MPDFTIDDLNQIKRKPQRGSYERDVVYSIIDEALYCHVGFVQDDQPIVIPTIHARLDDALILHGAKASRMLKHLAAGQPVCVTITLLDGLVFARSVFNHSMNYRSVVVFGHGRLIEDADEKWRAVEALTEHIARGRWADSRQPTPKEMDATAVVSIAIERASAKIRTGPPGDDEADYALPVWAGVLPTGLHLDEPIPDPRLAADIVLPDYLRQYSR
ncbi:MAG: pyridoxamine 5'-phosphate oxidase family protein [Caldilineales bacterium]|nr:pyridoxamine 5'-phosphate oxidase family protein [Caldilineales bacterium]MCW5859581.1 pyridoxamine 5'-phosphate oxidase family protein [Caldilineales bacterium]